MQPSKVQANNKKEHEDNIERPRRLFAIYVLAINCVVGLAVFCFIFYQIVIRGEFGRILDFVFNHPAVSI
jgi:hypothetical protein